MNRPSLPNYVFCEKLGQGSYAQVFKAFKKEGAREVVAIKCISKKILNKKASDNLVSEIGILKKIKHENIVQLVDFTWDAEYIYLILDFCPGGDLSKFIREKRCLPESEVRRFLQQLAQALNVLHKSNIVHMDLKPQNILLTSLENPIIKVADFGFAQHMEKPQEWNELRGSPLYMAPEIFSGGNYSAKCDLWSVGVILFECLFGQAPFASANYDELITKIISPTPIELPVSNGISGSCADLLVKLLARKPEDRIDHEAFFRHPFVDLEHAPSAESCSKGAELIRLGVAEEQKGRRTKAYNLYTEGLTHLTAALRYERNSKTKEGIRNKIHEYMAHVEQLAGMIDFDTDQPSPARPEAGPKLPRQFSSESHLSDLRKLCINSPILLKGVNDLKIFYIQLNNRQYKEGIHLFQNIFEDTREALASAPSQTRQLYFAEIEKAMCKAEDAKELLNASKQKSLLENNRRSMENDQSKTANMPVSSGNKPNLLDTKSELIQFVRERKALTESLSTLERQIYLFEGSYLEDTAQYGNIIKGWDRYLTAATSTKPSDTRGDKRMRKIKDSERLFSRSSVTGMAAAHAHSDIMDKGDCVGSSGTTPSQLDHASDETQLVNGHIDGPLFRHTPNSSSSLNQVVGGGGVGSAKRKYGRKHGKTR